MTNLIASMDSSSEDLSEKISILKEFRSRTSLPNRLFLKIKRHFENNSKNESSTHLLFYKNEEKRNQPHTALSYFVYCLEKEEIVFKKVY